MSEKHKLNISGSCSAHTLESGCCVNSWTMSFFSSLVANVTSGVANLSSRRFSLNRQDSNEGNGHHHDLNSKTAAMPTITVSSSSNVSTPHGECFYPLYSTRFSNYLFSPEKKVSKERCHLLLAHSLLINQLELEAKFFRLFLFWRREGLNGTSLSRRCLLFSFVSFHFFQSPICIFFFHNFLIKCWKLFLFIETTEGTAQKNVMAFSFLTSRGVCLHEADEHYL